MQVVHNVDANQFEARVDDQLAFLVYSDGVGNELARAALEFARESKIRVIPTCPFVRSYIRRHPQYADLTKVARG